jgi:hypothetical protein
MADEPDPEMIIGELKTHVDQRFSSVDERFVGVDQRFDQIDQWFAQIDERFAQVDRRFEELERRIVAEHTETRRHSDVVAERLEGHVRLSPSAGMSITNGSRTTRRESARSRNAGGNSALM